MATQKQTATIIDLLSEGPIEGLVGDDAGIFLNGTPILDSEDSEIRGTVPGQATTAAPTTNIDFTPTSGVDLTTLDISSGVRYLAAYNGVSDSGCYILDRKHRRTLYTPNTTWTSADVGRTIILEGGTGGVTEVFNIERLGRAITGANSRVVLDRVSNGPYSSGNTRTAYIVETREITAIVDSDTLTVDSAFTTALSSAKANILPINSMALGSTLSTKNFESAKTDFRSGRRDQPIFGSTFGGGQTSFATKLNEEILQTTRTGTYSIDGQDSRVYDAIAVMGIASPENIDKVKLNFQVPSLIVYSQSASEYAIAIELQIYLEYKRDTTWYNSDGTLANTGSATPIYGISDDDIQNRGPVNIDDSDATDKRVTKYSLTSLAGRNTGFIGPVATKTEFIKEFTISLDKIKPYTNFRIRVKRVTGVNIAIRNESQGQSQSYLQAIFAYSNDIINYSNSAVAGIRVDSTDFDAIPDRSYLARGMKIQVPTNYLTREETGGAAAYTRNITTGANTGSETRWDGKFRGDVADVSWREEEGNVNYDKVYTNNPAWVYYDIMINNRYGLGEYLEAQNINKYELYRIARYCDELVPNGKGGTEPRFTCNLYLKARTEAYKVINDLASVFRSIVTWTNGEISAAQDAPKGPLYTFSNSNIVGGQFGYESTSKRLRINQVGVTWNNPEDFYKQDVVTVEDSESIIEEGKIIKKDTVAVGCTSEGQATRLGKWMLITERSETELVKFKTGINGAYLRPGDIFYVQDYSRSNAVASGRLAQSNNHTTTTVYFDRTVPFEADTYELHLAFPVGSAYLQQDQATINSVTYYRGDQITDAYLAGSPASLLPIDSKEDASYALDDSGDFVQLSWSEYISVESQEFVSGSIQNLDSITVASAFTSVPNSEVMFTLTNITDSNTAKGAVAYRTLNVVENDDKTLDISGHIYLADKFAAVDRGYLLEQTEFTPLPTFDNVKVPAPETVSLSVTRVTSNTDDSTDTSIYIYSAQVSWSHARVAGTEENYQYVDYYEIKHPYTDGKSYEIIKGTKSNSFTFTTFVDTAQAYVLVRTVSILGRRSPWAQVEKAETIELNATSQKSLSFLNLLAGGNVNTSLSVDTGTGAVSFADSAFNITSTEGTTYSLTGVTTLTQGSPAITNGEYFYISYDNSATEFKLLEIEVDTTAEDPATGASPGLDFQYWKESAQDPVYSSVGTISQDIDILDLTNGSPGKALFTNVFTTTADYSADYSFGDIIRIGSTDAERWYGTVLEATATTITTVEYINKAFSSGAQIYNKVYKEEPSVDFIIGRVLNNAGTHELELFAVSKGAQGVDGANGASVNFVFARASTAPNTPTADGLNIPSQDIQWYDTPPSGTPRLWASKGTAGGGGTAYAWGAPYQVVGDAVAELKIYSDVIADGGSAPTVPTSGTSKFNFVTSALTINNSDWNGTPGNLVDDGDTIYSVSALVSGSNTDTNVSITWSAPAVVYSAKTDGITGVSLNLTAHPVSFSLDGTTYDPNSISTISLSAFGGTITGVTWSKSLGVDTLNISSMLSPTLTFAQGKTLAEANASNTVIAEVTGTTSDGTTNVAFGTITVKIPTVIEGPTGSTGASGLRTVQGYLYYEKDDAGAPTVPGSVTYTFSTGDLAGGSGANEVLALSSTSTIDKWTNAPRTQSATSSNYFWTTRYTGTETTAGSASFTVSTFSTVVQQTSFTGLVTFSGGTFSENGSPITTIDGGGITAGTINASEITTGTLAAANISGDLLRVGSDEITGGLVLNGGSVSVGKTSSASTTSGFWLGTDGITGYDFHIGNSTNFLKWDGSANTMSVAGTLQIGGGSQLTEDNTINQSSTTFESTGVKPVTITGNKISIGGTTAAAWDTQVYSKQGYPTSYVSFVPDQGNKNFMMGLDTNPTEGAGYNHINYKWYATAGNTAQWRYNEGSGEVGSAASGTVTDYSAGDVFTISYDGSTVRWLKDGVEYFSRAVANTASFYMDSSFSSNTQSVSRVQFGPITSNNYSEVGGTKPPSNASANGSTIDSSGNIVGGMVLNGGSVAVGKTSSASTTSGFWLGTDGSTGYDFHIGNSTNFLKWDGSASTLNVAGTLQIGGGSQLTEDNTINQSSTTFEYTGVKPVTITGNKISIGGTAYTAWDTQVYSTQGYPAAYVSFVPDQGNKNFMMGLDNDPTSSAGFDHINYKWYIWNSYNAQGRYNEGSGEQGVVTTTFSQGAVFTVSYDGSTVRWLINGEEKFSRVVASTNSLYVDSSFSSHGQSVSSVQFGPITSNNYNDVGGTKPPSNASANGSTIDSSGNIVGGMALNGGSVSVGKTSSASTTSGFWLGTDGSTGYDFHIGNSTNFLKWDGSANTMSVAGTLQIGGGSQLTEDNTINQSSTTFEYTGVKPVTITGNKISIGGTTASAWDTQVYSKQGYPTSYVSFVPDQANKTFMIGLDTNPTEDASSWPISYKWYVVAGGAAQWRYNEGAEVGDASTATTYDAGDVFTVSYDGSKVHWLKNGVEHFSRVVASTDSFYMDSSFYTNTQSVSSIQFGPITSNNYSEVGGTKPPSNATANGSTINSSGNVTGDITMASGSIVAQTDVNNSIKIDGVNKVITITDSGTVRVKLGKLS